MIAQAPVRSAVNFWQRLWAARWGYFFVAPLTIVFVCFGLFPFLDGFVISMQEVKFGTDSTFVGLANYGEALRDPAVWRSLRVTLTFVLALVPLATCIQLLLSVLVFRLPEGARTFYKAAFYLPAVISAVVLSIVWWWIFNPTYGLANYLITLLGGGPVLWLSRPGPAIAALIIMSIAGGGGGTVVLYVAAIGGIPASLYETAEIDGATAWSRFRHVTLPLLKPTTLYVLVTGTIGAFQIFTPVFILTQGGPARSTETVAMLVYTTAFVGLRLGPAAATSILLFGCIALVTLILFRTFATDVEY